MTLSIRPTPYSLPSYSLTGDLLGFLRCGLQYRYTRIGRLPPSKPLQLWFGEFIHGVLEEAYRRYKETVLQGHSQLPPWSEDLVEEIRALIKQRLAARGLVPWEEDLERLGDRRAEAAIQELGPHLFPLIFKAEVRLHGARDLPSIADELKFREADRYEMVGVVDVVTHVQLDDPAHAENLLVRLVKSELRRLGIDLPNAFEIIIDYKGMRRPSASGTGRGSLWEQYQWQIQTYAELRRKQADALPVAAGVLLYVNELAPTASDLVALKQEANEGATDVAPAIGSDAAVRLQAWSRGNELPELPLEFRLYRAIRVVPVTATSVPAALRQFDQVVQRIETCRGKEASGTSVIQAWERNHHEEQTCVVCDSRTFCPDYQAHYAGRHGERRPRVPAVKSKPRHGG
jgi:hypothetical protein